jgi:hypothetical protein
MQAIGSLRIAWVGLACFVALGAAAAAADDSATPERLLAADSALYWRFDGWEPHRAALDKTAFAELMRGDLGKFLDYLEQLAIKELASQAMRDSLLAGKRPDELLKLQAAVKQLPLLWQTICRHGVAVGVEITGKIPSATVTIVLPHGKPLYAITYVLARQTSDPSPVERTIKDRLVVVWEPRPEPVPESPVTIKDLAKAAAKPPEEHTRTLAWAEGDDLVVAISNESAERIVGRVLDRRERNLLGSPIFKRAVGFKDYETLSHGFVDLQRVLAEVAKLPDWADVPKFARGIGMGNVRQLFWHTGVEGRHQRYTVEVVVPGEREGVLRLFAGSSDFLAGGLPPLPPDLNQLHVFNLNLTGFYDGFRKTAIGTAQLLGEDTAKVAREFDDAQREAMKQLGIDIQRDLLDSLGTTTVVYSTPSEGPLFLGTGVAMQVVHEDRLRKALDDFGKATVNENGGQLRIKHRDYHGSDIVAILFGAGDKNEIGINPFTPCYAIHKGWLVFALNPQTVEGYIMRTEGSADTRTYQTWKPSPLYIEVLEKMRKRSPAVKILSVGESDPRPAVKFALSFAPLLGGFLANMQAGKFDNSMIPNTQSVVEPLYPSVSILVDDGESLRLDGYKSAPFPLDSSFFVIFAVGSQLITPFLF